MSIVVIGVNHRTGPLAILERLAIPRDDLGKAVVGLVQRDNIREAAVLSTCGRTEVYIVAERFHANTLKKLYPGVRVHRTYAEYAEVLHARLGIGAGGDVAKAQRLLARIQAGNQVRSVD